MIRNTLASIVLTSALCLVGCEADNGDVDTTRLAEFRSAVSSKARLMAVAPTASTSAALGDPALYPTAAAPVVTGINGSIEQMIDILEAIVATPPTVFDSVKKEYVWGPYPADDGIGYIAAYIVENDAGADFAFEYAFLRGVGNDLATLTPVIYGAATPDPTNEEHGAGVTLWDFEADYAFRMANDPNFDPASGDRGRFAALYAAHEDADNPGNDAVWVVAVLRNFVSANEPGEPADLDYFFGHYVSPTNTIDFIDFEFAMDADGSGDGVSEDVGIRLAFLDEGVGRAEADATGGTMATDSRAEVVECWDTSLDQTYTKIETFTAGQSDGSVEDGLATDCGLFEATLTDLQIPSLQDVDPALMAALDEVATNGIPSN